MKTFNMEEVVAFIESCSPETTIYLGCDSERIREDGIWYADYTLAIVCHIDSCHGCKVFGEIQRERDYDKKLSRPSNRLMTEVYKISELYLKLADVLHDRLVEIHLDINPNEMFGSSCVVSQAIGYIKGTCNMTPKVKPDAFAASYTADRMKFIVDGQEKREMTV